MSDTTIRFAGITSGMDTEAIIQSLLEVESVSINQLEDKVLDQENEVYAWNTVDSALAELSSITGDLNSYTIWQQKATSTTDLDVITSTAEVSSLTGIYDVDVTNLAVAHRINGIPLEEVSNEVNSTTTPLGYSGRFSINGQEIEFTEDQSLEEIALTINVASEELEANGGTGFQARIIGTTMILESKEQGTGNEMILQELSDPSQGETRFLEEFGFLDVPEKSLSGLSEDETTLTGVPLSDLGVEDSSSDLGMTGEFTLIDSSGERLTIELDSSDEENNSLDDIVDAINSAENSPFSANIDESGQLVITSLNGFISSFEDSETILEKLGMVESSIVADFDTISDDGSEVSGQDIAKLGITDTEQSLEMSGTFTLTNSEGQTVTINVGDEDGSADSLQDMVDQINEDENFSASIVDNGLVITSANGTFTSFDDSDGILQQLGVVSAINSSNEIEAEDLTATIDGIDVTAKSNEGVDSILSGVSLTFKSEGTATIEVNNESAAIKDLILNFMDKYNETMDLLEQISAVELDDSDEEVTGVGLLQGEFLISDIQIKSRNSITGMYESAGDEFMSSLYDLGIWTTTEENRLEIIDESKLDNALENSFDEVEDLFRHVEYDDDGTATSKGLMRSFDDYLQELITPLTGRIPTRVDSIQTDITNNEKRIFDKETELEKYEDYLWQSFANMETSISSIQSDSQYMLQNLGM